MKPWPGREVLSLPWVFRPLTITSSSGRVGSDWPGHYPFHPGFQLTYFHARDKLTLTLLSAYKPCLPQVAPQSKPCHQISHRLGWESSTSNFQPSCSPLILAVLGKFLPWHCQLHQDNLLLLWQPHDEFGPQGGGQYCVWEVEVPPEVNLHLLSLGCLPEGSSFAQEPTEMLYLQPTSHLQHAMSYTARMI